MNCSKLIKCSCTAAKTRKSFTHPLDCPYTLNMLSQRKGNNAYQSCAH